MPPQKFSRLPLPFRIPGLRPTTETPVASARRSVRARLAHAFLTFAIAALMPASGHGVLLTDAAGTGNTTAPPADPGFANVGALNGLSGTYVRNGWVLTAGHVGIGSITLLGQTYDPIPGSLVPFQNPDSSFADMVAFKLQDLPPLPALTLASGPRAVNEVITMIGNGRNRGAATSWMGVNGWFWGPGTTIRWGTNRIYEVDHFELSTENFWIILGSNPVPGGGAPTSDEADIVAGDSGGAAFVGSGASAELVGLLFARAGFENQPAETSLLGNAGLIADLWVYRDDVLAVIDQPDCDDGLDDDGDGLVDYPADPGCDSFGDTDERGGPYSCDNGVDDDLDTFLDYPDDPDCTGPYWIEAPEPGFASGLAVGLAAIAARGARRPPRRHARPPV